jgi:hypothetical protein
MEKQYGSSSKTRNKPTIHSAIPLLGIYLKECKSGYNIDTFIPMFIAALFTIAKLEKEITCPTTDEQIKKMWYIYHI